LIVSPIRLLSVWLPCLLFESFNIHVGTREQQLPPPEFSQWGLLGIVGVCRLMSEAENWLSLQVSMMVEMERDTVANHDQEFEKGWMRLEGEAKRTIYYLSNLRPHFLGSFRLCLTWPDLALGALVPHFAKHTMANG
jgi:hypothetical protein